MKCTLCPRACGVDRKTGRGVCGETNTVRVARAGLHFGEEPCISGTRGSGAVFFTGCSLGCAFCQNARLTREHFGIEVSESRLSELFLELQEQGAETLNLVTASHFAPAVARALSAVRSRLRIPVVYNTGGYDTVACLSLFAGLVDVYLPDDKWASPALSSLCAAAPDYPEVVQAALAEMARQVGAVQFTETGILQKGMLIRHLVLPGQSADSLQVLDSLAALFPDRGAVRLSLMRQYTPMPGAGLPQAFQRAVTALEYERVVRRAQELGFLGYTQGKESVGNESIPVFDGTGI